ncbi:DUF1444 family protein [Tenacibaculum sp. MEBiC07804]|uniref:DUF1444 family protein n=1 Tax=Tenacibaculum sp. MEBiC07804 TaxID=3412025 RepID=UPI003BA5F528
MKTKYLPQFFIKSWETEYDVFGIKFTNEVSIGLIEKLESGYSFISSKEFRELEITPKELLSNAIDNLRNSITECELKIYKLNGGKICFWNSENDNFTAVRILLPEYQKIIKEKISENFNFSIPSRDIITCWKSKLNEENSKFDKETKKDFKEEEYNLSKKVYEWRDINL